MGKNHRHKKQLKSEKAKVKLKLKGEKTKFLPKGQNVTNTEFKIKPILLPQQLKTKAKGEILSRRNLNIKELLSRLKHHNVNTRRDSCEEIKQVVLAYSEEILQKYLGELLHDVCPLVLDSEKSVRKEAVKAIGAIIQVGNEGKLSPFFNVLSTYARCAMTHIDRSIQEDSLYFLHLLLKHVPALVVKDSDKILPNFLSLISKFKNEKSMKLTLTVNLSQKVTSVIWRIKVLQLLTHLLAAVMNRTKVLDAPKVSRIMDGKKIKIIPIFSQINVSKKCPIDFFSSVTVTETSNDLSLHMKALLPLLHETWLEVIPDEKFKETTYEGTTVVSHEAATVLTCILRISCCLLKYIKENAANHNIFLTSDGKNYVNCLVKSFPYSQDDHSVSRSNDKAFGKVLAEMNNDPQCTQENLLICYLFCCLYGRLQPHQVETGNRISEYLRRCLINNKCASYEIEKSLISVVKIYLLENGEHWGNRQINVYGILENVIHFYNRTQLSQENRVDLFNTLAEILNKPYLMKCPKYDIWLSSLPALLCKKEISEKIVDTILLIAKQNNELFHKSFLEKLNGILDNLPHLKVVNFEHELMAYLKIIALFYYIPIVDKENLLSIVKFVDNVDYKYRQNLVDTIKARSDYEDLSRRYGLYC